MFKKKVGAMNKTSIETTVDRRGRIFINGVFLSFEDEKETFKALAKRYLIGELHETHLLSDPPQVRFDIKTPSNIK